MKFSFTQSARSRATQRPRRCVFDVVDERAGASGRHAAGVEIGRAARRGPLRAPEQRPRRPGSATAAPPVVDGAPQAASGARGEPASEARARLPCGPRVRRSGAGAGAHGGATVERPAVAVDPPSGHGCAGGRGVTAVHAAREQPSARRRSPRTGSRSSCSRTSTRARTSSSAREGFHLETLRGALGEDELAARIEDVHVLGIRSKTHVTDARPRERAPPARASAASASGPTRSTSRARTGAASRSSTRRSRTRAASPSSILAEIVMLSRQLGDRSREMHAGQWRKVATGSFEVRGKTLGIVGYGHIGRQVGVLAEAMGMRVALLRHRGQAADGQQPRRPRRSTSCSRRATSSRCTCPRRRRRKDMIGARELAAMRPGSYLLNASRGTVVDIAALADGAQERPRRRRGDRRLPRGARDEQRRLQDARSEGCRT